MNILITGATGFIGYNLANNYLNKKNNKVYGIDCLDDYYSVALKKKRLQKLKKKKNFFFGKIDLCDYKNLDLFLKKKRFDIVIHLAAQAGVRYSIVNPQKYLKVNLYGYLNLLKLLTKYKAKKILYASSSSVYGENTNFPLKENEKLNPKNVYGLTKKLNEIIAEYYYRKFKTKIIGLRFFTVYGEWGRPDMFFLKLFRSLKTNHTMFVNNFGDHVRDFTYIGDVVKYVELLAKKNIKKHDVYNICSNNPVNINKIVKDFKKNWKFKLKYIPMDGADIYKTHGSNSKIIKFTKFKKLTNINVGIKKSLDWYIKEKIYNIS